jgi:histidine triad (HIT) family protein
MDNNDCGICCLLNKYAEDEEVKVVYESEYTLAVYSTKPFAQVHIFIASKKHISTIFDLTEQDNALVIDMMTAVKIASKEIIEQKGACKLEMYLGEFQNTKHLHCHVIYDPSID